MLPENIPVHNLDESDFFVIEAIENCETQNFNGVHRHNFHEILFFTEAEEDDVQSIDFIEHHLQPNQLYLLRQGQVHKMQLHRQQGYLFAISPKYFDRMDLRMEGSIGYDFPSVISLNKEDIQPVRQLAALIFDEFYEKKRKEILDAYMHAFFTLLMFSYAGRGQAEEMDIRVKRFLASVEKYFTTERSSGFYARQASLSCKRLNELIKQAFGKTVIEVIHERLLLEAKRLICYEELSFKEIAFKLGFKDASYFTRFFRGQSGMTPEQFRQSL